MGLYDRLENERIGEEARRNQAAESRGTQIAKEQLDRAAQIEAENEAMATAEAERESNAYREGQLNEQQNMLNSMAQAGFLQGQQVDPNQIMPEQGGLGMGSQTMEGMQQQQAMQEGALEEAAMGIIQQLGEAQAQGANSEEMNQMFESIPPELKGKVMEIKQIAQMQQEQQAPQTPTGRQVDPYGITAGSAQLLQETMQPQQK